MGLGNSDSDKTRREDTRPADSAHGARNLAGRHLGHFNPVVVSRALISARDLWFPPPPPYSSPPGVREPRRGNPRGSDAAAVVEPVVQSVDAIASETAPPRVTSGT